MTMVARTRVATRATGIRRQVFVHVYDDREQMARAHTKARDRVYRPEDGIAGGVAVQQGFSWPRPEYTPIVVMRLWTEQLTTRTITHEATHAATAFYFMDSVPGWDTRARSLLMGDHEPLAYLVGDIAAEVVSELYRLRLLPGDTGR